MDWIRRELQRYRGVQESIPQRDGSRVMLPPEHGTASAQGEAFTHEIACARADAAREPRPVPTQWHLAVAGAADRLSALRLFHTTFELGNEERHVGGPYCLDCLVRRGELVDMSVAPADSSWDTRPIPHGQTEPIPWDDVHALYKAVA